MQTLHPSPHHDCLSEYRLERYLLELEAKSHQTDIASHLQSCPKCQQNLRTIANSWETPDSLGENVPKKFRSVSQTTDWFGWFGSAVAASVCFLFVFGQSSPIQEFPQTFAPPSIPRTSTPIPPHVSGPQRDRSNPHPPSLRARRASPPPLTLIRGAGMPKTIVVHKWRNHITQLQSGAQLLPGSRLRLAYHWKKGGYIFVLHRDAKGAWSPLYPEQPDKQSLPIAQRKTTLMPGSLLVEGPNQGREEIWSCFSQTPLSLAQVQLAIQHKQPTKQGGFFGGQCLHLTSFAFRVHTAQP